MKQSAQKKYAQLGMHHSTARQHLIKKLLFKLAHDSGVGECFRCGKSIDHIDTFTIEHKMPWLDSQDPKELFFDLDNVAFSHHSCNAAASRGRYAYRHGTWGYKRGCRCKECRRKHKESNRRWRERRKKRLIADQQP